MTDKTRRIADWVKDIRETIGNMRSDMGTLTKSEYREDGKSQRAVIKGLTDTGEAANNIMKLAPGLRQSNPDAWQHLVDVYAMRIRLTHTYHRTNPNIVFDTVLNDLPALESQLDNIRTAFDDSF
ncbi:MAG: DUF86 domain-containing protein [Comamonadaceae bacterium]|nr:DUF86 domain-containing protein [Comamonadaceae bacterium]